MSDQSFQFENSAHYPELNAELFEPFEDWLKQDITQRRALFASNVVFGLEAVDPIGDGTNYQVVFDFPDTESASSPPSYKAAMKIVTAEGLADQPALYPLSAATLRPPREEGDTALVRRKGVFTLVGDAPRGGGDEDFSFEGLCTFVGCVGDSRRHFLDAYRNGKQVPQDFAAVRESSQSFLRNPGFGSDDGGSSPRSATVHSIAQALCVPPYLVGDRNVPQTFPVTVSKSQSFFLYNPFLYSLEIASAEELPAAVDNPLAGEPDAFLPWCQKRYRVRLYARSADQLGNPGSPGSTFNILDTQCVGLDLSGRGEAGDNGEYHMRLFSDLTKAEGDQSSRRGLDFVLTFYGLQDVPLPLAAVNDEEDLFERVSRLADYRTILNAPAFEEFDNSNTLLNSASSPALNTACCWAASNATPPTGAAAQSTQVPLSFELGSSWHNLCSSRILRAKEEDDEDICATALPYALSCSENERWKRLPACGLLAASTRENASYSAPVLSQWCNEDPFRMPSHCNVRRFCVIGGGNETRQEVCMDPSRPGQVRWNTQCSAEELGLNRERGCALCNCFDIDGLGKLVAESDLLRFVDNRLRPECVYPPCILSQVTAVDYDLREKSSAVGDGFLASQLVSSRIKSGLQAPGGSSRCSNSCIISTEALLSGSVSDKEVVLRNTCCNPGVVGDLPGSAPGDLGGGLASYLVARAAQVDGGAELLSPTGESIDAQACNVDLLPEGKQRIEKLSRVFVNRNANVRFVRGSEKPEYENEAATVLGESERLEKSQNLLYICAISGLAVVAGLCVAFVTAQSVAERNLGKKKGSKGKATSK